MSSSGFGIIRAVNSGDSVSIYESIKSNGPPPIRDISLSNVQAPKLGYNNTEDKPWAWKSREFLRELCIGKRVKFTIDHKTANEREFGSVITDSGLDLGIAISEAGWAEIRSPPDGKEPRTDSHRIMLDNQTKAKEQKIGIWQEDTSESLSIKPKKLSTMEIYDKYKEKTVDAIIEYVRDANCVTVIMLDSMQKINIRIAGIDAPRVPSKVKQDEGEKPEPVGLESRFFVEKNLLHRTVKLTITAPSESNRKNEFYGDIELAGHTLASQLIKNGYAKLLEWSAVPTELPQLKQFQQDAISKKLRVWKYVSAPNENTKTKAQWTGRIKEIRDGGALVIKDSVSNEKKFVILSNVKVPRIGRGDPEPYGYQARELLRKKTLGKQVTVIFDYDRNDRDFVTVLLDNKSIALFLVESGYAKVVSFEGNAKSSAYQLLTIAENRAKSQNKNIWGKKAAPIYRVTDTTLRSNDTEKRNSKQKAKQFYGALQRAGRVSAIVEHVMNGSRFKLSIPKENCIIMFGLEAIKTLSQREEDKQPLGIEAYNFSYDKLYQRDVEVIVESIDMAGNFFGSLFIKQRNFGITLLEMGYATLNNTVDRTNYALEYKQAEEEAKKKKIRIWSTISSSPVSSNDTPIIQESNQVRLFKVRVSEIVNGNWFYLQMIDDKHILDKIMQELNIEDHPIIPNLKVKRGNLYTAKMPDDKWYRVKVEKFDKQKAMVICIDYGNGLSINTSDLRPLSSKLSSAPIQAKECHLAYLSSPTLHEDYGEDAENTFYNLSWGKDLLASVEYMEGTESFVCLGDGNTIFNHQMVESGYAYVSRNAKRKATNDRKQKLVAKLLEQEEEARKSRKGMWELGDFRDDE